MYLKMVSEVYIQFEDGKSKRSSFQVAPPVTDSTGCGLRRSERPRAETHQA